eukprot:930201-Pyramimonas_sp.AAC.1
MGPPIHLCQSGREGRVDEAASPLCSRYRGHLPPQLHTSWFWGHLCASTGVVSDYLGRRAERDERRLAAARFRSRTTWVRAHLRQQPGP